MELYTVSRTTLVISRSLTPIGVLNRIRLVSFILGYAIVPRLIALKPSHIKQKLHNEASVERRLESLRRQPLSQEWSDLIEKLQNISIHVV